MPQHLSPRRRGNRDLALAFALSGLTGLLTSPVLAHPPLQSEAGGPSAYARRMNEYAQLASDRYDTARYDPYDGSEQDDGYYSSYAPVAPMVMEQHYWLEAHYRRAASAADPQADARFRRFRTGGWDVYQSHRPAEPGDYCAASYLNPDGLITLTGMDRGWEGALFIVTGERVPRPESFQTGAAIVELSGRPPVAIEAYGFARDLNMPELGSLAFAAGPMALALDRLDDEGGLTVTIAGEVVFQIAWQDGGSARHDLGRCLDSRKGP